MLFIRNSLPSARKLFQRTIQSVKSLFIGSTTYQRLHKAPSFNPFSCVCFHEKSYSQSYRELDRFYSEYYYTNRWESELDVKDNIVVSSTSRKAEFLHRKVEENRDDDDENDDDDTKNRLTAYEEMLEKDGIDRRCLVAEKLKDLEMIESNYLENVQDIEEVLHLYSLLTCPVYIDIFDKFAMDMYSNIFNLKAASMM